MSTFKTPALALADVVSMVEAELPEAVWAVGKCRCGDPAGDYAGTIHSADFAQYMQLDARGLVPVTVGWSVHAHAATATDALGIAYGTALGEGRS